MSNRNHKSIKLTANGLFESSRMMLPEHVEAFKQSRKQALKKTKPELDEQKIAEISSIIHESYYNHIPVKITVFDEYEEQQFVGVVTHVDPHFKNLKLEHDQQYFKIDCSFITDVAYEMRDVEDIL